jgi:hypothetical protein
MVLYGLRIDAGWASLRDQEVGEWPTYYNYLGFIPGLDYYVVHEQYWEGSAIHVVHRRTGWSKTLDDIPVPDRTASRAAVASSSYYGRNVLSVYRVIADTLALEWEVEPDAWSPHEPVWSGPDRLVVDRRYVLVCEFPREIPWYREVKDVIEVMWAGGTWQIRAPTPEQVPDSVAQAAKTCYQTAPF